MAPTKRYKASSKSSSSMAGSAPSLQLVTVLNVDDVLLGRGAQIMNFMGNVRFRDLVHARRGVYMGTGRHNTKQEVAQQIYDEVHGRGGRFLRRLEPNEAAHLLGVPHERNVWVIASEDVAMEKVKQALRDKEPVRTGDQGRTGGAASGDAAVQESTASNDIVLNSPPASDNLVQGVATNVPWQRETTFTAGTPQALPPVSLGISANSSTGLAPSQPPIQLGPQQLAQLNLPMSQHLQPQQQPLHPLMILRAQAAQAPYGNAAPPLAPNPSRMPMLPGLQLGMTASDTANFFNTAATQAAQRAQQEQLVQQAIIASLQQQQHQQRQRQQDIERQRQLLVQQQLLLNSLQMPQHSAPTMPQLDYASMTGGLSGLSAAPLNSSMGWGAHVGNSIPAGLVAAPGPFMLGQGSTPLPATSVARMPPPNVEIPVTTEAAALSTQNTGSGRIE